MGMLDSYEGVKRRLIEAIKENSPAGLRIWPEVDFTIEMKRLPNTTAQGCHFLSLSKLAKAGLLTELARSGDRP